MSASRQILARARRAAPVTGAATVALLLVCGVVPAQAHAVDLFPVDDWIGDGLKAGADVVLGPLKFGAEALAKLLSGIVVALADLLIPKSLVKAGMNGIEWLVTPAAFAGTPEAPAGVVEAPLPHVDELRNTLTWIGLTLMPLQLVIAGGRSVLSPSADSDAPSEILQRTIFAAIGLIAFNWFWATVTQLVRLTTSTLLGLPWVTDGVEKMLESLLIGGAAGTAVAAEFVIPLLLVVAGGVLLALLLMRIGTEVLGAIIYATGGLALGVSVSGSGYRILQAWLVAVAAVFAIPVLWTVIFVVGAALMLDASEPSRAAATGFGGFVGQLYNTGVALVTFGLAIKIARATLGQTANAVGNLTATLRGGHGRGTGGGSSAGRQQWAQRATPDSLTSFSRQMRGGMRGAAAGAARAAVAPARAAMAGAAGVAGTARASGAATAAASTAGRADQPTAQEPGRTRDRATRTTDQDAAPGTAVTIRQSSGSAEAAAATRTAAGGPAGAGHAATARQAKPPTGGSAVTSRVGAGTSPSPPATRPSEQPAHGKPDAPRRDGPSPAAPVTAPSRADAAQPPSRPAPEAGQAVRRSTAPASQARTWRKARRIVTGPDSDQRNSKRKRSR